MLRRVTGVRARLPAVGVYPLGNPLSRRISKSVAGFTLIEVLIAMAITAFVALVAYTTLSTVIGGVASVRDEADRLHALTRAMDVISRDIRQIANRPIIDEFGMQRSALEGGPLARETLALTRAGWHNTTGAPRSTLQRVAYYLDDDQLIRAVYPVLDRTSAVEPRAVVLLEDVSTFELRFLANAATLQTDRNLTIDRRFWEENWLADLSLPATTLPLPQAIEIRLELESWGQIERLYVLPGF